MKRFGTILILFILLAGTLAAAAAVRPSEAATNLNQTSYMPVILGESRGEIPQSIYGLQIYNNTGPTAPFYAQQYVSGASWIRVPLYWHLTEPDNTTPDNYSWGYSDAAMRAAQEGFTVIGTISGLPEWVSPYTTGVIPDDKMGEFTEFLSALVERFDGDGTNDAPNSPVVNYFEMFNEPDAGNLSGDIRWGNHGAEYADMLAVAHQTIKAANPNAKVLFGGIAYDWFEPYGPFVREFLDDVLRSGGCPYFDYMNFHLYPAFANDWADYGPAVIEKSRAIQDKVIAYCGSEKPMMITETGWHDNDDALPPSSPETQAHYVVQLGAQSKAAGIETMIWWLLWDIGFPYPYNTGLIDLEGTEKPAYLAYQTLVAELGTAQFVRTFSDAETGSPAMEVHKFEDPARDRTVYVAWLNPIDTTATRPLSIPAARIVKRSLYGIGTVLRDGDDGNLDGRITLTVGGAPIYLEIEH